MVFIQDIKRWNSKIIIQFLLRSVRVKINHGLRWYFTRQKVGLPGWFITAFRQHTKLQGVYIDLYENRYTKQLAEEKLATGIK